MLAKYLQNSRMEYMGSVKEIRNWFEHHIKDDDQAYALDKHQAAIIADSHQNTLVTARAGSGKTRTIVAKIVYLIAHEHLKPNEIVVFAFNRKAKTEINERLTKIYYDNRPLFGKTPHLATTFHAFAYQILGGKDALNGKIITKPVEYRILKNILKEYLSPTILQDEKEFLKYLVKAKQFIVRAEQKFFRDYSIMHQKIADISDENLKRELLFLEEILINYQKIMKKEGLINFNQMVALAADKLSKMTIKYRYIFVDEY